MWHTHIVVINKRITIVSDFLANLRSHRQVIHFHHGKREKQMRTYEWHKRAWAPYYCFSVCTYVSCHDVLPYLSILPSLFISHQNQNVISDNFIHILSNQSSNYVFNVWVGRGVGWWRNCIGVIGRRLMIRCGWMIFPFFLNYVELIASWMYRTHPEVWVASF